LHIYLLSKEKSLRITAEVREQKGHYSEVEQLLRDRALEMVSKVSSPRKVEDTCLNELSSKSLLQRDILPDFLHLVT